MITLLQQLMNFESLSIVPREQLNWLIKNSKVRKFEGGAFVGMQGKVASSRIAELIGSVKTYTHMDRGRIKYIQIFTRG